MDLSRLLSIEPLQWSAIGAALLCGFIIGLERQIRGKPVGVRTSSLIVLSTYVFVSLAMSVNNNMTDPSRIIGQVVTGVGFLGAGVMLAKGGMVLGVTSAATIWVLASVGVCIAVGGLSIAVKLSIIVVIVLAGVDLLEDYIQKVTRVTQETLVRWKGKERREKKRWEEF